MAGGPPNRRLSLSSVRPATMDKPVKTGSGENNEAKKLLSNIQETARFAHACLADSDTFVECGPETSVTWEGRSRVGL